jgi:hypothetical protein
MVRDTYILYTETQRVTTYILYNKYEMAGDSLVEDCDYFRGALHR